MISFSEQIDMLLEGKFVNTHLHVCDTPALLQQFDIPNLPILITKEHTISIMFATGNKSNVNYHGLGVNMVKELPNMIQNPAILMESLTRENSYVILSNKLDSNGNPVIISILIRGKGKFLTGNRIDANILTSAYGKDNFEYWMNKNVLSNSIKYIDVQKIKELQSEGVQFPSSLLALSTNNISNRD